MVRPVSSAQEARGRDAALGFVLRAPGSHSRFWAGARVDFWKDPSGCEGRPGVPQESGRLGLGG